MMRLVFSEIGRARGPLWERAVLLCVVRPLTLSEDVRDEVFAGLQRTNCDFVVFETAEQVHSILAHLPPGTKLLET
jgi:hypothetical protein